MRSIETTTLAYEANGFAMEGWLAFDPDAGGARPGILVFPALPGLGTQIRTAAERLAALGYVALGCDIYGGGHFFEDVDEAAVRLKPVREDVMAIRSLARGALEALAARPEVDPARIAAIGYCFGGICALELARDGAPIAAVVGFHTPLGTPRPEDAHNIVGSILICTGSEDREANVTERAAFEAEMRAGGVAKWHLSVYGGVYHSFTNPDADAYGKPDYARYDPRAHARSWNEMLALFDEVFAPSSE